MKTGGKFESKLTGKRNPCTQCSDSCRCTTTECAFSAIVLEFTSTVFDGSVRRYIGALGARVICDNIPGLVNKQRQLCQRHPDLMQSISEGAKEWIKECQHQFRHHRWNCSTLDRDHTVFGRVMLRSESEHTWLGLLSVWFFVRDSGCLYQ